MSDVDISKMLRDMAAADAYLGEAEDFEEWRRQGREAVQQELKPNGRANPNDDDWPDPLGEAAFCGLAGDVVRAFAPHTEADQVALLLQVLAAFGNAAGRGSYFRVEGDRHPPQIWPVLVGKTAKARKGTSWGRIRSLFEEAAPDWERGRIVSGLSSGEGLIWNVRDPITTVIKDKATGLRSEVETDAGIDDKRLFVLESEFASPLRHMERSGNILSSTLRTFWDSGKVSSLTKSSPAKTTGSMITIVGHITVDELRRYLTRTEMGNGLANRFLFALVQRSKELPLGGGCVDTSELAERIGKLLYTLVLGDTPISFDENATTLWKQVDGDLSRDRAGLVGSVTSRAEAQVIRLALTYALLDGENSIAQPHLEAALEVWRYCDQSAAVIFGASTGDPLADEICRMLKAAPDGLTRANIYDLLGRNRSKDEIGRALALLLSASAARSETRPTGGRPEERWFSL
jgi:hypothetical protein